MQASKKNRKKRIWLWVFIPIVILVVAATFFLGQKHRPEKVALKSYTVSRGDLESTITGSGKLEANDSYNIDLPDNLLVSQVLVKVGDQIQKGHVLAILDHESLQDRAAYLSDALAKLDKDISSRETSQYIYAPVEGRIKYISVSKGSDVAKTISEEGSLALISTDGLMKIDLITKEELTLNEEVSVKWADTTKTGKVARRTPTGYIVTLTDKGTPYKEHARVYMGDALIGEGSIEINTPITVYGNNGTIKKIHYNENTLVSAGSTLFTLKDPIETNSYRLALTERNEMAEELKTLLLYINNPQVIGTIDGLVSEVMIFDNVKTGSGGGVSMNTQVEGLGSMGENAGVSAKSPASTGAASGTGTTGGSGFSAAFSIHTGGAVKMYINVDELDVNSVVLDQEVTVTLDAFTGKSYKAKVTHISKLGTASGNITTYPVELSLDYNEQFLEGMNGSAVITTERIENVLCIPIAAIYEDSSGSYVYVTDGESQTRADITTGISDGVNAQVTEGLAEGDVIQYVDTNPSGNGQMGGFGGMGGGSPFGRGNPFEGGR